MIYRYIILAQACSDYGKLRAEYYDYESDTVIRPHYDTQGSLIFKPIKVTKDDYFKFVRFGYKFKDHFIKKAIDLISRTPDCGILYSYSNGVVFFKTPYGQVSFHTRRQFKSSPKVRIKWNKQHTSRDVCRLLAGE